MRRLPALATILAASLLGCTSVQQANRDPAAACAALAQPIAAADIGLPTRGAVIESATLVPATALAMTNPLPFVPPAPESVVVPALPQHCRVIGAIQYFVARDAAFDPRQYDPLRYADRTRAISALMDSTDPDLSAFRAHGGKLVISEHLADYAQSPFAGIDYVRSLVARMGQPVADEFVRLYTTPGADHVGTGVPVSVDMLDVLVAWVEQGRAPGDLVQVELEPVAPFAERAARPMCRWPAFPRYRGQGDPRLAASFECAVPAGP